MRRIQIEDVTNNVVVHADLERFPGVVQKLAKLKQQVVLDCMTKLVGQLDYVVLYLK